MVQTGTSSAETLRESLSQLNRAGLQIFLVRADNPDEEQSNTYNLDVLGHDRPGILSEVTQIMKSFGANIQEIETELKSAPEAGHLLFHASLTLTLTDKNTMGRLTEALEDLSPELQVSLT